MNELVHDLTSALEESELKIEIDVEDADDIIVKSKKKKHFNTQHSHLLKNNRARSWTSCNLPKKSLKNFEPSRSGSETESTFALPVIKKHRRKKATLAYNSINITCKYVAFKTRKLT